MILIICIRRNIWQSQMVLPTEDGSLFANPELCKLVQSHVKGDILKDYTLFEKILPLKDDKAFCKKYDQIKQDNKVVLRNTLKRNRELRLIRILSLMYSETHMSTNVSC